MSNTKRKPLLSDEELDRICEFHPYHAQLYAKRSAMAVDALHEAARAKDAELIQRLIHEGNAMAALIEVNEPFIENDVRRSHWHSHRVSWMAANDAAEAAGYKSTKP
jgi:N-acyl-D-aspartate/D-glutamate deacylase